MIEEEITIRAYAANKKKVVVGLHLFLLGFHTIFDVQQISIRKTINNYVYGLSNLCACLRVFEVLSKM